MGEKRQLGYFRQLLAP